MASASTPVLPDTAASRAVGHTAISRQLVGLSTAQRRAAFSQRSSRSLKA